MHTIPALIDSPFWKDSLNGWAVVSVEGTLLASNPWLAEKFGYTMTEMIGKHFSVLTHPEDLAADAHEFEQVLLGKLNSYTMHKRYLDREGKTWYAKLKVIAVRDDDGTIKYLLGQVVPLPNGGNFVTTKDSNGDIQVRPSVKLTDFVRDNWKVLSLIASAVTVLWNAGKLIAWLGDKLNVAQ